MNFTFFAKDRPEAASQARERAIRRRPQVEILEDRTVPAPFGNFLLHTSTPLAQTGTEWQFLMADWNVDGQADLVGVRKSGGSAVRTRVLILDGATNFQNVLLSVATALPTTNGNWEFLISDWNVDGRPDLVGVAKQGTGSNRTEVHILNGANFFRSFLLNTTTAFPRTGSNTEFLIGDWNVDGRPDLFGVAKFGTASGRTEVHILSGATNFQTFLVNIRTAQHVTDSRWDFLLGDWDNDGRPDLIGVQKSGTASGRTEVHILSGASNFQTFVLHAATAQHQTDFRWEFAVTDWNDDGRLDLVGIQKSGTRSFSTEVHILSGAG